MHALQKRACPQCHQSIELHQDKEINHTSESTINFLEKIEQEIGTKIAPFTDISDKSPNVSTMDFCASGLLKSALSKRRPTTLCGLWKGVQEE
ncbi:hypothetical protein AVEN_237384-1 [Araneus ventricosus]|uniref:Uncharacterized protein n=1 Tax=Araneus ventricosus TaxID=182803 RepID=A0A4Y2JVN0_ARAVE|nr:hypothetical protein AVEN_237384-1 [Araneus ventricosus]